MKELTLKTAPRHRLLLRTLRCGGVILESQSVMGGSSHGWAVVLQHFLDRQQVEELWAFLGNENEPNSGVLAVSA